MGWRGKKRGKEGDKRGWAHRGKEMRRKSLRGRGGREGGIRRMDRRKVGRRKRESEEESCRGREERMKGEMEGRMEVSVRVLPEYPWVQEEYFGL